MATARLNLRSSFLLKSSITVAGTYINSIDGIELFAHKNKSYGVSIWFAVSRRFASNLASFFTAPPIPSAEFFP